MTEPTRPTGRRRVLGRLAATSAAAAAVTALPAVAARAEQPEAPADPQPDGSRGYHATDHVRRYYALARF